MRITRGSRSEIERETREPGGEASKLYRRFARDLVGVVPQRQAKHIVQHIDAGLPRVGVGQGRRGRQNQAESDQEPAQPAANVRERSRHRDDDNHPCNAAHVRAYVGRVTVCPCSRDTECSSCDGR